MAQWFQTFLGKHCKIRTGKKDVNEGISSGEYPFFTCSRDISWSDFYSFDTEAILIAGNGDVGNLHYFDGKFEAYQRTYVLDSFDININYVYQYLQLNLLKVLEKEKTGTSIPYIKLGHLKDFPIYAPISCSCQQKIARILQTIDRAIEKTEALIDKYQQIKAGLMHDLFTRGIGADGQLRPPREQAPELYQETPIGWIPKEWGLKPLKKGLSTPPKNGYSPKEVDNWEGLYVLGLSCLTKSGFKPVQLKNAPKNAISSGALLDDGDFLISRSNTSDLVGLCGIYKDVGDPAIYPDLMVRLRLNSDLAPNFLEKYLLTPLARKRVSAIAIGTSGSMVKINGGDIKEFYVPFPSTDEQKVITAKLDPVDGQISALETQCAKLHQQKSGLMQDLLTGKVPVHVEPETEPEAAHV